MTAILSPAFAYQSETRAIMPKLPQWKAFFISHGCGDGALTTKQFLVPNFFRANTSAPMGARSLALYLKDFTGEGFRRAGLRLCLGRIERGGIRRTDQGDREKPQGKNHDPGRQQGLLDLHHQDHAIGRQALLSRAARRRGPCILCAGDPIRTSQARAAHDRDRRAGQYPGPGQGTRSDCWAPRAMW